MNLSEVVDFETLGVYLRENRLSRGLGQDQLAERAGMTTRTIRKYESGEFGNRSPKVPELCRVLSILRLDDYETVLHVSMLLNSNCERFTFSIDELPFQSRDRFRQVLIALATLVNVRDICPTSNPEATIEFVGKSLNDVSERPDSWLELLRHSGSPGHGGGTESADVLAQVAPLY